MGSYLMWLKKGLGLEGGGKNPAFLPHTYPWNGDRRKIETQGIGELVAEEYVEVVWRMKKNHKTTDFIVKTENPSHEFLTWDIQCDYKPRVRNRNQLPRGEKCLLLETNITLNNGIIFCDAHGWVWKNYEKNVHHWMNVRLCSIQTQRGKVQGKQQQCLRDHHIIIYAKCKMLFVKYTDLGYTNFCL